MQYTYQTKKKENQKKKQKNEKNKKIKNNKIPRMGRIPIPKPIQTKNRRERRIQTLHNDNKKEKTKMKEFEIITKTKQGIYTFLTKAENGKSALKKFIEKSNDFKQILNEKESNFMDIKIRTEQ